MRVVVGMPRDAVIPREPDLDYMRAAFKKRGIPLVVDSVTGASRFRVRSRLASRFYVPAKDGVGAVVLAGDAAHTHRYILFLLTLPNSAVTTQKTHHDASSLLVQPVVKA